MSNNKNNSNLQASDVVLARNTLFQTISDDSYAVMTNARLSSLLTSAGFVKIRTINDLFSWIDSMSANLSSKGASRNDISMGRSLDRLKQQLTTTPPDKQNIITSMIDGLWLPSPEHKLQDPSPKAISLNLSDGGISKIALFQGLPLQFSDLYKSLEKKDSFVFIHEMSHANAIMHGKNQESNDLKIPQKWKAYSPSDTILYPLLKIEASVVNFANDSFSWLRNLTRVEPSNRNLFNPQTTMAEGRADIVSLFLTSANTDEFEKRRQQLVTIREFHAAANVDMEHRTSKALLSVEHGTLSSDKIFEQATIASRKGMNDELLLNEQISPLDDLNFSACLQKQRTLKRSHSTLEANTADVFSCGKATP